MESRLKSSPIPSVNTVQPGGPIESLWERNYRRLGLRLRLTFKPSHTTATCTRSCHGNRPRCHCRASDPAAFQTCSILTRFWSDKLSDSQWKLQTGIFLVKPKPTTNMYLTPTKTVLQKQSSIWRNLSLHLHNHYLANRHSDPTAFTLPPATGEQQCYQHCRCVPFLIFFLHIFDWTQKQHSSTKNR